MKRYSRSLLIREGNANQSQKEISSHIRQFGYKNQNKNPENKECWQRCEETGSLMPCYWGCKVVQAERKNYHTIQQFHLQVYILKRIKIETCIDICTPMT